MSHLFRPVIAFLFHLGYFGPLVLGIADSSFLVLPIGNDLLVVGLVASHSKGIVFYIVSAVVGSTLGVALLDLVARKFGEEGICKMAGKKRYDKLKKKIGERAGWAVMLASLSPPPFPFTMVIGTTSALKYSRIRLLGFTFLARSIRFTILGLLALQFGNEVTRVAKSAPFQWCMTVFIALCVIATGLSIWKWLHSRSPK